MASTMRRAGAPAQRSRSAGRLRVHIHNNPEASEVNHVTPARLTAGLAKFPGLAAQIAVTIGADARSLDAALGEAEVLCAGGFDARDLGARAPHLTWVQSTSAGVEKLIADVPRGVVLTNASGVHGPKGGEYAMTALLMLNNHVPHYVTAQRAARWEPLYASPIAGKTVVMVGVGAIGTAAARLARRFGMRVLGVGRAPRKHRLIERVYGPRELETVLPKADFVLVTLPLTAETKGMLGRAQLDLLPRRAGLVNLGRGAVIDNDALADKLRKGELAGAVLDVFPVEPLPADSPLWSTPNLIISPHCAVDDAANYAARALDIFLGNLARYLGGRKLVNIVDPKLGY